MRTLNLPNEVIISLEKMNITTPTEIQKQAIPLAMQGIDILASSQTGSGKTLAYLLPIINAFINNKSTALVLVPTRELATQIRSALTKVTAQVKMNSAVLIGGEPMPKQFMELRANPQVIIGTPGRIIDHLTRGSLKLNEISLVVLDEMDRMLDMGMKEQLEEINKHLPEKRQVLMFSATMPKHIVTLSQKYTNNPQRITIGSATKAAADIKQDMLNIPSKEKFLELVKQLNERKGSVIIFVNTKRLAAEIAKKLNAVYKDETTTSENVNSRSRRQHPKVEATAIHGDLNQRQRERVILSFRNSYSRIMVATDVAARGLDIPHTQHVINYDLPMCPEDYLHRIGRTGRAGAQGFALSFISPEDNIRWRAIERLMNQGETTLRNELMGNRKRKRPFDANNRDARGPKKSNFSNNGPKKHYENNYRKKKAS